MPNRGIHQAEGVFTKWRVLYHSQNNQQLSPIIEARLKAMVQSVVLVRTTLVLKRGSVRLVDCSGDCCGRDVATGNLK